MPNWYSQFVPNLDWVRCSLVTSLEQSIVYQFVVQCSIFASQRFTVHFDRAGSGERGGPKTLAYRKCNFNGHCSKWHIKSVFLLLCQLQNPDFLRHYIHVANKKWLMQDQRWGLRKNLTITGYLKENWHDNANHSCTNIYQSKKVSMTAR